MSSSTDAVAARSAARHDPPVGLRERKKAKTRASLREHALRLFLAQGFAATTVEQIAEAAEVSPATFFRYFATKEDVVLIDDVDPILLSTLRDQPAAETPLATVRAAIAAVVDQLTPEQLEQDRQRQQLMQTVPQLRMAFLDEFARNVDMIATGVAERFDCAPDDLNTRVFAGAIIGASLAAINVGETNYRDVIAALELLEAGLPLRARRRRKKPSGPTRK
jgi:AcrR family transcriptional regulator